MTICRPSADPTVAYGAGRRPFAVFDLDDTLNRLAYSVSRVMARRGFKVAVSAMRSYSWSKVFGLAAPSMGDVAIAEHLLEEAAPNPAVVHAAQVLLDAGWRVEVWTARAWHPHGASITRDWLDRYDLGEAAFRLTGLTEDKSTLTASAGVPDLYIDDNAAQVNAMRAAGCAMPIVYARPWNVVAGSRMGSARLLRVVAREISARNVRRPQAPSGAARAFSIGRVIVPPSNQPEACR